MNTHTTHALAQRLLAVLGATLLLPACIDDVVDLDSEGATSGTSSAGPVTTSDSATSVASSQPPIDSGESPECGSPVSRVVCVDPFGDGSGTAGATTGADPTATSDGTDGGDETGEPTTGEATGTATGEPTTGEPTTGAGPLACEGVEIHDYSFCVYEEGEIFEQDGQCCRLLEGYAECCDGRPFLVDDELRVAPAVRRDDWQGDERPAIAGLSAAERATLAAAWQADGLLEHASIASFARFVLHLMALGAPPSLVAAAQQAMADEIEHARRCFALAAAYAGHPVGPGPLCIDGALAGPIDLRTAAVAAVREGCIGETLAAHQARAAAEVASDPVVRRVLAGIAEEEARHAELAWRFVAWALAQGGAPVREAVARAFTTASVPALVEDGRAAPIDAAVWRAHGRLAPRELATVLAQGRREIIEPCARALLAIPCSPAAVHGGAAVAAA